MQGKIIKGVAGSYLVHIEKYGILECKAKGIFRNRNVKPLVGDNVTIQVLEEAERTGTIIDILKRKNELIRPAAANIDQAVILFAACDPVPNLNLLDRFIVMMEYQKLKTVICFNKTDRVVPAEINRLNAIYEKSGGPVVFLCAKEQIGIEELREYLLNKTSILAGPSGVGKSTILNLIHPEAEMETGTISQKIRRGKHTTRHTELFYVCKDTFLLDTPGFSSLNIPLMEKEELKECYHEFRLNEDKCRFNNCVHIDEPGCAIKNAVDLQQINQVRYENYRQLFNELKSRKKY